jgi:hypothetical protein
MQEIASPGEPERNRNGDLLTGRRSVPLLRFTKAPQSGRPSVRSPSPSQKLSNQGMNRRLCFGSSGKLFIARNSHRLYRRVLLGSSFLLVRAWRLDRWLAPVGLPRRPAHLMKWRLRMSLRVKAL